MMRFEDADRSGTPLRRTDGAVGFVGTGTAASSLGRGRGTAAVVVCVTISGFVCSEVPLKIGAGCEPDCMNSALTRTVIVSRVPSGTPKASRGFQLRARKHPVLWPPG